MGNKLSCCKANTPNLSRKEISPSIGYRYDGIVPKEVNHSNFNLQHISERKTTEDIKLDPSTQPTVGPLFMQRSRSDIQAEFIKKRKSVINLFESRPLKKSSSCSTIYLDDSTVSHPDPKKTLKWVTLAIYYHIKNRTSNCIAQIFDERYHPLSSEYMTGDDLKGPNHYAIHRFMRALFYSAQLPPECAIITLVYLERLLAYSKIDLLPCTWRRILLGATILASKVWDDQAVWNVDYCLILRSMSLDDMNALERHFLEFLQFNINVPSSVYTKYYFELRALANQNDLTFPQEPLSKERASRLEAMSRSYTEKFSQDLQNNCVRKWGSFESISPKFRSKAIIS